MREIEGAGGRAAANYADVSNWKEAEDLISEAADTFGDLNILVCNAGIVRDRMMHNMSEQEWDDVVRVHLKGHFAPTKFATQYWREQAKSGKAVNGRVVYTTSEGGFYGSMGQANYCAAKAGIIGLAFAAARELQKLGVTVNAIAPRGKTPMTEAVMSGFPQVDGFDVWDADNVAPWVGFLATDQAAEITGQVFVVYGGTVMLASAWPVQATLEQNARWTIEELLDRASTILPGLKATVPAFPDLGLSQ